MKKTSQRAVERWRFGAECTANLARLYSLTRSIKKPRSRCSSIISEQVNQVVRKVTVEKLPGVKWRRTDRNSRCKRQQQKNVCEGQRRCGMMCSKLCGIGSTNDSNEKRRYSESWTAYKPNGKDDSRWLKTSKTSTSNKQTRSRREENQNSRQKCNKCLPRRDCDACATVVLTHHGQHKKLSSLGTV